MKLRHSSAEMLCLLRYFNLIVGDLIPDGNKYWNLYLILRQILGITTAPRFAYADVSHLRHLIKMHNDLYVEYFGSLKPKMHFMTHMPRIMLDNGPLIYFWSMAFKRKNKALKDLSASNNSHRNVPLLSY